MSTLPVYAAFLDEPFDPSPYAPASRLHWNEVYLDDASVPAAADADVRRRSSTGPSSPAAAAGSCSTRWPTSIRTCRPASTASSPAVPTSPTSPAGAPARATPADAGRPRALVERSHLLAQYLADRQLAAIEGPGRATLALDLPIGSHPDGYETWAHGSLFAAGMDVGAPPDEFFAEGQNWGFPPQLPGAGRRSGHALWRDLVARAGEHASVLRIDHVMGVQRLWWIPDGCSATDGVYVRYPREELLAVIAAEAERTSTTIVGENLGTVPAEVTEALERWDVIGMFEEQFNLYHRSALPPVPADSVAGIRTHDMPAFAAAFNGDATGGVYDYRRLVADAVGRPVGDGAAAVLDAALERLAAQRRLPRRRRPRRPRRRDRAAQRAGQDPAVDVAPPAAPADVGDARRPRRPPPPGDPRRPQGEVRVTHAFPGHAGRCWPLARWRSLARIVESGSP